MTPARDALRFRIAISGDAAALTSFVNATYHGPEAERGWTPETHLHGGPRTSVDGSSGAVAGRHELRPGPTADEIQKSGFELVNRDDRFIDRPGEEDIWWLIVARKP